MVRSSRQSENSVASFEGRTWEEAVRLAQQQLGGDAPVRCWKARRGGLLGFFAKEVYVAGVEPPQGAVTPSRAMATSTRTEDVRHPGSSLTHGMASSGPTDLGLASFAALSDLVESMQDELTLGSERTVDDVFSDVLAQAQAALVTGAADVPVAPPVSVDVADASRIENLGAVLSTLGFVHDFWPSETAWTLDGLAGSLSTIASAEPIPLDAGSLTLVVGPRRDAQVFARRLVGQAGLLLADIVEVEQSRVGRQRLARRRLTSRATLVVVDAPLRSRDLAEVADWIASVKPDYVLGVVSAATKRTDVEHWRSQLGQVDSLALSHVRDTSSPGELVGVVPISYLDGERASTLRWVALVLASVLEQR